METERLLELLAYAKVCFEKCTNPFELIHLVKKRVTADECRDLSQTIADILEDEIDSIVAAENALKTGSVPLSKELIAQAEKDFAEAQRDLYSH